MSEDNEKQVRGGQGPRHAVSPVVCVIRNWRSEKTLRYNSLMKKEGA